MSAGLAASACAFLEVPHLSRRTLVGGRPLERDDGNCATDELDAPARYARLHLADHRPPGGWGHSAQSEAWGRIGSRSTSQGVGYAFGQIPEWTKHRDVDGEVEDLAAQDWPGEDWPNVVEGGGYAVAPVLTKSYVQWLSSGPPSLGRCGG